MNNKGTRGRKNYSGMAPITRASGTRRMVLARPARNRRLANALYWQAFAALSSSPGARAHYDAHRARGATHHQALRALSNRLVGILHSCPPHHTSYNEVFSPGFRTQLKGAVDAAGQACSEASGTFSAAPRCGLPPGG